MIISGMVKSSLIDYPGLIACVLFVPGCNYGCFFCHNRSLIDGTSEILNPGTVEDFLRKRAGLLDGAVITGGEPTLQPGLAEYAGMIKGLGYKIKLDTNGSSPKIIESLLEAGLCDYYAVDYKAPASRYEEICGGPGAETALETIELLLEKNADFEVRTTVIPQLAEEDLITMAKELPVVPKYVLNRYRKPEKYLPRDSVRAEAGPYSQGKINEFAEIIKKYQPNTAS